MPEEKSTTTPSTATAATPVGTDTYKRVYPDWKPSTTLEKADVAGTIEAIEDARTRDKSAWRKSNLNVPNSSEDTETYSRRLMRQRSRDGSGAPTSSQLQSIIEEDRRKSVIQALGERAASDRLQIYIRRPSDSPEAPEPKSPISSRTPLEQHQPASTAMVSDHHSIYIRPKNASPASTIKQSSSLNDVLSNSATTPNVPQRIRRPVSSILNFDSASSNTIEIDSDNIETPPTTRRNNIATANAAAAAANSDINKLLSSPCRKLQTPRPLHKKTIEENNSRVETKAAKAESESGKNDVEPEKLGDGQFDRYSSTRRTRRYKRPTDHSSTDDNSQTSPESSHQEQLSAATAAATKSADYGLDKIELPKIEDKEARLKRWQERLKSLDREDGGTRDSSLSATTKVLSRVGKVGRNISSINQEDVREAIRNLKSPTETPERVWSPPREINKTIATVKAQPNELNDEGFEETQSLVSDTPSHGKESTSSCNEQVDVKAPQTRVRTLRMTSSDSAATTISETSKKKNKGHG